MLLVRQAHPLVEKLNFERTTSLCAALDPGSGRPLPWQRGSAVLSFETVEEVCQSRQTTLVIHPAIRRAIKGYEESFYVGLRCFLAGETDGLYFLPLQGAGYVRLIFSKRVSSGGYNLLRIDPLTKEGLARIKASLD
jgi:hypothetical protein